MYILRYCSAFVVDNAGGQTARNRLGADSRYHRGTGSSRVVPAVAEGPGEVRQNDEDFGQSTRQLLLDLKCAA